MLLVSCTGGRTNSLALPHAHQRRVHPHTVPLSEEEHRIGIGNDMYHCFHVVDAEAVGRDHPTQLPLIRSRSLQPTCTHVQPTNTTPFCSPRHPHKVQLHVDALFLVVRVHGWDLVAELGDHLELRPLPPL